MSTPWIALENVTFRYPHRDCMVLNQVNLTIQEGDFVLVVGPSGSGKSTLLRTLNGLVPHFSGGRISGKIRVAGYDPIAMGPHRMSPIVGFVQQEPEAQFVVDTVEDELAFGMENQGLPQTIMRKRVEEVLDQLGIAHLRHRRITSLSAGEKQRVAIGSVLTLQPKVLVLDEPTSQLDPQAAEEVLTTLRHLNQDLGLTIVLSEHRLERVMQYADHILYLPSLARQPILGKVEEVLPQVPFAPPLIQLARAFAWQPMPLTVKEARAFISQMDLQQVLPHETLQPNPPQRPGSTHIEARDVWFSYNGVEALRGISLRAGEGDLIALMGRNGSGKTTLLKHLVGLLHPKRGYVTVHGKDTRNTDVETLIQYVGYVPQDPNTLLFASTVRQELEFTLRAHSLPLTGLQAWLERLGLIPLADLYPRDLSVGQRQRIALAAILVADPPTLLLDEPTRGLDPLEKQALADFLRKQVEQGRTIILATHDVELAAECAHRVVIISEGQVLVDGPVREVMSQSLVFASQVNKLFRNPRLLTVRDVLEAQRQ